MSSDWAFVIDIGTTKTVALAARLDDKSRVTVEATAVSPSRGVEKGVVEDVSDAARTIMGVIEDLERSLDLAVDDLTVVIGGSHVESKSSQGYRPIMPPTRPIGHEDVLQVINHSRQIPLPADREQIQAVPREFRVDNQRGILTPVGMTGARLEVVTHLITGSRVHISQTEKAVEVAGRHVEQMVAQPLAAGLGVVTEEAMDLGCAVVNLGASTTDIAIFIDCEAAFVASLPVGSQHVTNDIAYLLKVDGEEAERLKVEHGGAMARLVPESDVVNIRQKDSSDERPMQRKVLCEIIESRLRETAGLIDKILVQTEFKRLLPGGIFLTGGGANMPGIDGLFSEVLDGVTARRGTPKMAGQNSRNLAVPEMAVAVGLARYALEIDSSDYQPVAGFSSWKDKIRSLRSRFSK